MLQNVIKNIGLTDKEAAVYIGCLKLGSAPISHIAKEAKVNRVTAYSIIEKLLQKGLINKTKINEIQHFEAIDPNNLYIHYKEKLKNLKEVLPDLKKLIRKQSHPLVKYFEGVDGIKAIYNDTLTSKTEILSYANSADIRNFWPEYDKEYVAERVKNRIFLRGLASKDEIGKKIQKKDKENFRKIKLIETAEYEFANEILIYDNKVAYTSLGQYPVGTIIEDEKLANTQRAVFELVWTK